MMTSKQNQAWIQNVYHPTNPAPDPASLTPYLREKTSGNIKSF